MAIVSGLSADPLSTNSAGHLCAVDAVTRAVTEIWPWRNWSVDWDQSRFPDCTRAPDPTVASPHGMNIEQKAEDVYDLYVVNHGGREVVEVFELDLSDGIDLAWTGCVTLPGGTFANGVVVIRDGRTAFVAEWGGRQVHRIPLDRSRAAERSAVGRATIDVPFTPDDLANCPTGV